MKLNWEIVLPGALVIWGLLCGSVARAARIPRIELMREIRAGVATPGISGIGVAGGEGETRAMRPIGLLEVYDAIRESLASGEAGERTTLRPEDILLQAQILVAPGDAGLQVLRAELDSGLRRAKFLVWSSKNPRVVPFVVTAKLEQTALLHPLRNGAAKQAGRGSALQAVSPVRRAPQEILVPAGQQATLVLHSPVLRVIADVIPLERGVLGQRIRVRMVETGKIFIAQVDGRAHLDINF
ncbi:MAG: flagella basal body P-ring formation protein FlgA [Acidobacteriia bacterium]|nr:flagella basal body P-ring formation protein FlgA [Terriglobia bacterium]